jgi:tetratricopeptide (TPR) repeat protein
LTDFERAINELQLGNYSEGMVILQKLLKDDPDNIDILYNLGMCYSEMGLLKKSIETLERCTRLAPDFDNALVALGFSYFQSGDDEKAMALFDQALGLDPDNVYALKNKGALMNKSGQPDQALAIFKKADALMPDNPDVLLGLGQAYEYTNQLKKAAECYKRVRSLYSTDLVREKAVVGLNRIAVAELKQAGEGQRVDVIMYCLDAIEFFAKASSEKVKEVSFEIAMLGNSGLSINDPEKKYTLKSLEGNFSGSELLCYMFVGFKIIDQSLPPFADLENEYQQALKIYRSRLNEH